MTIPERNTIARTHSQQMKKTTNAAHLIHDLQKQQRPGQVLLAPLSALRHVDAADGAFGPRCGLSQQAGHHHQFTRGGRHPRSRRHDRRLIASRRGVSTRLLENRSGRHTPRYLAFPA